MANADGGAYRQVYLPWNAL